MDDQRAQVREFLTSRRAPGVLVGLARALQPGEAERTHLFDLARPPNPETSGSAARRPRGLRSVCNWSSTRSPTPPPGYATREQRPVPPNRTHDDPRLTSSAGQALVATAGFLYAELTRPDGISTIPAACHELESALITQLLMTVPSQRTQGLHGKPAHTWRSKIRESVGARCRRVFGK
ncbi:hypothetical protein [Rhodococcus opacus]|uniref:hypothetical protein n=1 Tax=Rhodococcus opacus TaxID=37919 RepID=UPI0018E0F285|nr:hypothetical protein [Rhodococcus opacus]